MHEFTPTARHHDTPIGSWRSLKRYDNLTYSGEREAYERPHTQEAELVVYPRFRRCEYGSRRWYLGARFDAPKISTVTQMAILFASLLMRRCDDLDLVRFLRMVYVLPKCLSVLTWSPWASMVAMKWGLWTNTACMSTQGISCCYLLLVPELERLQVRT
ncbi:hypothetical protein BDM02DRAFT_3108777 [Thelephora ganbajun]|uniref:Uncharacterized protein n=1 Tax=Thelephora ganbajun TaxID=370292 RepID=A0ACB6ZSV5_THEGA|nr:hypothetical protein BDM02DRAFT_3108777 [Thelephora ganbajun]